MKKLRKIIKDIVRQQAQYAPKMITSPQLQKVRVSSRKNMIITDDGVGRH